MRPTQVENELCEFVRLGGVHSSTRFIQKKKAWISGKQARDLQPASVGIERLSASCAAWARDDLRRA